MSKSTVERMFTYETDAGTTFDIQADADVAFEKNYGADADGYRALPQVFLEGVKVKVLYGMCDITSLLEELAPTILQDIEAEAEAKLYDRAWDQAFN
jgi:hypothetical protein